MRRDELIGRTIANRFRIRGVLGEGGMATVFVAEQTAEPREVALKILHPELHADKTFAKRFEREAKATARVQHPNAVTIFDSGVEGNLSYIAMELLRGDDLYALLERHGVLSPRAAVTILAEVCDALAVAHGLGIVHRDLKPENIMIVRDPSASTEPAGGAGPKSIPLPAGARVKVLDFGIAKLLDKQAEAPRPPTDRLDPPSQLTAVTRAGTLIGTPAYMSPEQCSLAQVDTRSDIYTCGVLLFQMVTGRLPFEGPTHLHIATKHIHEEPPALRSIFPGASPALDALILKALAKKPAERQPSARILAAALRKLLPDLPDVPYSSDAPGAAPPAGAPSAPLSADGDARSGAGSDVIASAKTMVAESSSGPPASVVVHGPEVRRPLAILARHPVAPAPTPAAGAPPVASVAAATPRTGTGPEPPRPIAILARHAAEPEDDTLPTSDRSPATPNAAGVQSEPEDLASTLVRGPPENNVPDDLAKTAQAFVPSAPVRAVTMQSATLPSAAGQPIAPRGPQVAVVEAPMTPLSAPTPAVPIGPRAMAAIAPGPAAPGAPGPNPAAQALIMPPPPPGAGPAAVMPLPSQTPIPAMPSASVILSPALAAPSPAGPPPPAQMPAPMGAPMLAPPHAPMGPPGAELHPSQPPPTFSFPARPAPPVAAASPVVGRVLWLGILIGVLTSAILFVLVYALFLSR